MTTVEQQFASEYERLKAARKELAPDVARMLETMSEDRDGVRVLQEMESLFAAVLSAEAFNRPTLPAVIADWVDLGDHHPEETTGFRCLILATLLQLNKDTDTETNKIMTRLVRLVTDYLIRKYELIKAEHWPEPDDSQPTPKAKISRLMAANSTRLPQVNNRRPPSEKEKQKLTEDALD